MNDYDTCNYIGMVIVLIYLTGWAISLAKGGRMSDVWYKISAVMDVILGAMGLSGTLMYDLLLHRDFRLGIHSIIAIVFFAFYVFKGIMLWALVSE